MPTVADHLLARLAKEGIDTAFLLYGGAISELADAFTRQSAIRYVVPMTEQCVSFAAEGYAKAKGVPGFAISTSGPGGHNMVTGIANCFYDSTPVIFVTGQVQLRLMRKDKSVRQSGFQESPIVDIVREITKWAETITHVASFPHQLEDAIAAAKEGRPGPVLLDLPGDIQRCTI